MDYPQRRPGIEDLLRTPSGTVLAGNRLDIIHDDEAVMRLRFAIAAILLPLLFLLLVVAAYS